jgi:neopullulanase
MKLPLRILGVLFVYLSLSSFAFCQNIEIQRLEPSHWYIGMNGGKLQLLVYGPNISKSDVKLKKYKGVKLSKINKVENPNYLFLDLTFSSKTKPGNINLIFSNDKGAFEQPFEIKEKSGYQTAGVNSSDFIYLLMPDRFANGDPSNDKFDDMADPNSDRKNPWQRHGGDLKGIQNHLDYFKELGVTALWLNPVLENNQPLTDEGGQMRSAYHGYGITNHYEVDKRLGGNKAYLDLVEESHKNNLKIIHDAVYNHVGINHWILKDLPMKSWLNQWDTYTNTSYKDQPLLDPHASAYDYKMVQNGWFVPFLPDLNQRNEFVANYLIQNALWLTEYFKLDAWRIDTYIYNDLEFMNRCNQAILDEYPNIHIFGESWVNSVPNQAYFTRNKLEVPFKCNQPGTVDFQLEFAINAALNESYGWNEGVQKLYQVLGQDYLYEDPSKLVTFLDNHDMDRYYSVIGEDFDKFKMGLAWLLTTRGIPQLYYGTEFLMKNFKNPTDAEVRKDFPGGFEGDSVDKFVATGRTEKENEAFNFVKKVANFRKNSEAIKSGKLIQFLPFDEGVYVYFRISDKEVVMVAANTSKVDKTINLDRFSEIIGKGLSGTEIVKNIEFKEAKELKIRTKETFIIKLKK